MRFAVYAGPCANYYFLEIRRLLACGLREAGQDAVETDGRDGFLDADRHLIVGAPQFFYLGASRALRTAPWPPGVILFNAEQPGTPAHDAVRRLAGRAHAVWDMDTQAPLGYVDCELFEPVRRLPDLPIIRGAGPLPLRSAWEQRPIDWLFIGSAVERRRALFRGLRGPGLRGILRLVSDDPVMRPKDPAAQTRALLGLAQRSKVVLNVHRTDASRYPAWHRIGLHGLGQGALLVSEPIDAAPLKPGVDYVEAAADRIAQALEYYLLSDSGRREGRRIAASGAAAFRRMRFSESLRRAISGLGRPTAHARVEAAVAMLREAVAA